MPQAIHRTAVFRVYHPTRHERAVLDRAFRDYTSAYTELLHAARGYSVDQLRGLATYELKDGKLRQSARALSKRLYSDPRVAKTTRGVCSVLESRLTQSVKEHVAQTLMSYVALSDAAVEDPKRGGVPEFPSRLRAYLIDQTREQALGEIAALGGTSRLREQEVFARLQQTRQGQAVAIPFVGIDPRYGCGLYLHQETNTYFARLDIVHPEARLARPITMRGIFTDIKTGERWQSGRVSPEDQTQTQEGQGQAQGGQGGLNSFGRGGKSILVHLALGRGRERRLRFTQAAYLPHRGIFDKTGPLPARPVSAKLVRKSDRRAEGGWRYEMHVSFEIPAPVKDTLTPQQRPLLAINRGIHALVAGVVTAPNGHAITGTFAVSGRELRSLQETYERVRRERIQRAGRLRAPDRRQSRVAEHHVAQLANQVVEMAVRYRAQVVMEDLANFATGHAIRHLSAKPAPYKATLRAILGRRQFQAVHDAINQRLSLVGLPPIQTVGASYISQTCWTCGAVAPLERMPDGPGSDPRVVRCRTCGAQGDVDVIAAGNVARKLAWLRLRGEEKKASLPEGQRTPWAVYAARAPIVVRTLEETVAD
jgi:hypothetical protein